MGTKKKIILSIIIVAIISTAAVFAYLSWSNAQTPQEVPAETANDDTAQESVPYQDDIDWGSLSDRADQAQAERQATE